MFEVANASGRLDSYDLAGKYRHTTASTLTHIRYHGWSVPLPEVKDFASSGAMRPAVFELLAQILAASLAQGRPVTSKPYTAQR